MPLAAWAGAGAVSAGTAAQIARIASVVVRRRFMTGGDLRGSWTTGRRRGAVTPPSTPERSPNTASRRRAMWRVRSGVERDGSLEIAAERQRTPNPTFVAGGRDFRRRTAPLGGP